MRTIEVMLYIDVYNQAQGWREIMLCGFFCDLSKAFDRVWHKGLIFKLQTYGISGDLLHWSSSYLGHRSQKVPYKDQL